MKIIYSHLYLKYAHIVYKYLDIQVIHESIYVCNIITFFGNIRLFLPSAYLLHVKVYGGNAGYMLTIKIRIFLTVISRAYPSPAYGVKVCGI